MQRHRRTQLPEAHAIEHHRADVDVGAAKGHERRRLGHVGDRQQLGWHSMVVLDAGTLAVAEWREHLEHVHHARLAQRL